MVTKEFRTTSKVIRGELQGTPRYISVRMYHPSLFEPKVDSMEDQGGTKEEHHC